MSPRAAWLSISTWSLYAFFIFIISLACSWWTLKAVDFGYPLWYKVLDFESAIAQYAPLNRYRRQFETTTREEHIRLFHEIVIAVHGDTDRLATLRYRDETGKPLDTLLREPEILHLQDVAIMLKHFFQLCGVVTIGATVLAVWLRHKAIPFPGMKKILLFQALCLLVISTIIWIIGPTAVFYQLHIWLFPPEHQWFFYYQESLMTTLMVAPDVFGPIAMAIVALAIPYSILGFWLATIGLATLKPNRAVNKTA